MGDIDARFGQAEHVFAHPAIPQLINLQSVCGQAKPYQIRELVRLVERYDLRLRTAMSDYHITVFYSDEDGACVADILDLDACSALGSTAEEALAEVERAKQAWLAAAREAGKQVPEPRYRPAIYAR